MSKKITAYTLKNCARCKGLKDALQDNRIRFEETTCESCPECCDSVEDFVNTINYPIVKVELENSEVHYFYIGSEYASLKKEVIDLNVYKKGCLTITDMFYEIESL